MKKTNNKRVLFIYNKEAGKRKIQNKLVYILDKLESLNYEIIIKPTQSKNYAYNTILTRDMEDIWLIVCAGGDGTLNEIVRGLIKKNIHNVKLGYIPCGSTNDFANSVGISTNIVKSVDSILVGKYLDYDIGSLNNNCFIYIAAFGVFSNISYTTKQGLKNIIGRKAYFLEGIKKIKDIKKYHLIIKYDDTNKIEDDFIFGMITNSKVVGGFRKIIKFNDISFNDGVFELTFIKYPKKLKAFYEIIQYFFSNKKPKNIENIITIKAKSVEITSNEKIKYIIDGEYCGEYKRVHIKNNKKRISFII